MSLNSFRNGMGQITSTPTGKATLFTVGAVLVFSLVYSGLGNNLMGGRNIGPGVAAGSGDDVIATVNGQPISRDEYENLLQRAGQGQGLAQSAFFHSYALDQLVSQKLELAQAQKMGITATDKEIAQARLQTAQQAGLPQKLSLPPTASIADMDAALTKLGAGRTVAQILPDDNLRATILLQKLQASFAKPVTEQDALDYYKEYHTRHILVDNKKVSDVQAQNKAQQILAKVKAPGANFAALANQYSEDPGIKLPQYKGGDDGWIGQDNSFHNYIPEFTKAVVALKPSEVTPDPVKTPQFGYFIIKLEGTKENLPKDWAKNKAQDIAQVKDQQQQAAYQGFLTSLKNNPANKVVVTDPALRGDQAMSQAQQGDPSQRATKLQDAVAAYTAALKSAPISERGEVNASLAQAYQGLNQMPQAIAALKAAVDSTHDQDLAMQLGNLYVQNKDQPAAIAQFQAVSKQAWNDPQVHQQLMVQYAQLKRADLSAQERKLYQEIQKRQRQASAPLGGLPTPPGGATVSLPTGSVPAASPPPQSVTVKPASGQPAKPTAKPGQ